MKKSLLISAIFSLLATTLTGCATSPDENPYLTMSCESLAIRVEESERVNLLDRVDLFNDDARRSERRASSSPYRDSVDRGDRDDQGTAQDREYLRTAYKINGCAR